MTILGSSGVKGHPSAKRDQLDYLELMQDRQVRAYNLVREEDRLIKAKHQSANEDNDAIMNNQTKSKVGDWAWACFLVPFSFVLSFRLLFSVCFLYRLLRFYFRFPAFLGGGLCDSVISSRRYIPTAVLASLKYAYSPFVLSSFLRC